MEKLTYTVPELGRVLGISRNLAYEAIRRGEVRAIRIGKRLIIAKSELQRLLDGGQQGPQKT